MNTIDDDYEKLSKLFWQANFKLQFADISFKSASNIYGQFLKNGYAKIRQEIDESNGTYKLIIATERMPKEVPMLVGAGIHSLRSALDTAVSMLAREAGVSHEPRINFPVHQSEREFLASFADGQRTCPDCKKTRPQRATNSVIRDKIPDLQRLLIEVFKPWQDGNFPLWALSKLDNIQKHQNLLLVSTINSITLNFETEEGVTVRDFNVQITNGQTLELWRSKSEIIFTETPHFRSDLLFPPDVPFGRRPVFIVLRELFNMVRNILICLQSHYEEGVSAFPDGIPSSFRIKL